MRLMLQSCGGRRSSGFSKVENSRTLLIKYMSDAPIAQMDRATDYESAGRGFKSSWARQEISFIFNLL
jgi:hypothetical protein